MKYSASLLSLCILITACGGGGGGDNGNGNDNNNNGEDCGSQDGSLDITKNNYKTVNAEAYDAVYSIPILADASAVILNAFTTLVLAGAASAPSTELVQQAVKSMTHRKRFPSYQLSQSRFGGTALPAAIISPNPIGCRDGGQYRITINDADNNNFISDGDAIDLDFANCRIVGQDSITILNNRLIARLVSINDNSPLNRPPYNIRFSYDQFTMQTTDQSGTERVRVDGDLRSLASCSSNVACAIRANGGDLTLTQQSSSANSSIDWQVSDYSMEATFNDNDREEEFSGDGVLYINPSSNGSVNFETVEGNPFVLRYDEDNPFTGEELSTGCNSSTRLTTLDNRNVRLELDEDGDDVYETTTTMTWDNLTEQRD